MDCWNGTTPAGGTVTGRSRRSEPEIQAMPRMATYTVRAMDRADSPMRELRVEALNRVHDEVVVHVDPESIRVTPPEDWVREYFTYRGGQASARVYRTGTNNIADVAQ